MGTLLLFSRERAQPLSGADMRGPINSDVRSVALWAGLRPQHMLDAPEQSGAWHYGDALPPVARVAICAGCHSAEIDGLVSSANR
jgi:hypothetical protein